MKWLIAPDSFKNCLRSPQVAAQLAAGIRDISPDDEIIELPLADGGEGTAEAAARAAGGTLESVPVTGPLGNPVEARFARLPAGTVVVEMAEAAGLERLPDGKNDPLRATTYGVGELFLKLLKNGTRDFVIGIGGSATVDGGLGFVQALGAVCRDAQGRIIPPGAGGRRALGGRRARLLRAASGTCAGANPHRFGCDQPADRSARSGAGLRSAEGGRTRAGRNA